MISDIHSSVHVKSGKREGCHVRTRSITTIELYLPNEVKRTQRLCSCNASGTSAIGQESVKF